MAKRRRSRVSRISRHTGSGRGRADRAALAAVLVLFVVTRALILFAFQPEASDASVYFGYACRAVDLHQTPYAGDLRIEFPPMAWWAMAAAYLINGEHVLPESSPSDIAIVRGHYMQVFRAEMCAFDCIAFTFLLLTLGWRAPRWLGFGGLIYVACTTLLANVLYDRLDAGLLMFFMAAAYCVARATGGMSATWWSAAAGLVLGLGASYKIIPIVALPFVALAGIGSTAGLRRGAAVLASGAIGGLLPVAVQYEVSGAGVFSLVAFHVQRGLQLESLYSTLMAIDHLFGAPIAITLWEGGADLSGGWAPTLNTLATILLAVFLGSVAAWCFLHARHDCQAGYRFMVFAIVGAVILSKVLSPQYFIWALPLMLLLAIDVLGSSPRACWFAGASLILIAALTTWVFPYHYFDFAVTPLGLELPPAQALLSPPGGPFVVLAVRNFAYMACVVMLGVRI